MILIQGFSLQNNIYQLPLCLGIAAVTLAQKLMPFLSRVKFVRAVSSIWNVRVYIKVRKVCVKENSSSESPLGKIKGSPQVYH